MVFVISGAALILSAVILHLVLRRRVVPAEPSHRPELTAPHPMRRWGVAATAGLAVFALAATTPTAHADPAPVTGEHVSWEPDVYNGYRVYVSPPRHVNSGSRGECGWEENVNGRHWAVHSSAWWHGGDGGFMHRGYQVTVGANARDDNWPANREASNNWGADVHLPTHTNALHGCNSAGNYFLVMNNTAQPNSTNLSHRFLDSLSPAMPGGQNMWDCNQLGECNTAAAHQAYVELFFHDHQAAADWYQAGGGDGQGVSEAYRYGMV